MATYMLTINERSTQGKALLAYLEALKKVFVDEE